MRTPIADRRPRAGMTISPRHRQNRPMPMSAVAVRRGRFGEFELRPVREHAVWAVPSDDAPDTDTADTAAPATDAADTAETATE